MFIAIAANSPGAPAGRDVLRDPGKPGRAPLTAAIKKMPIVVFDSKLAEQRKVLLSKTPAFVMFLLPIDVGYG
jgi:hypothetical protein